MAGGSLNWGRMITGHQQVDFLVMTTEISIPSARAKRIE